METRQDFHKSGELTLKWYFDACALDFDIDRSVKEMTNKTYRCYVSHLSLGEAYGNYLLKTFSKPTEEIKEKIAAYTIFMKRLMGHIIIVGNDNVDTIFSDLRRIFRLSITDAIHLATAVSNGCVIFRTADIRDFGNNRKKISEYVAKQYSLPNFAISVMK